MKKLMLFVLMLSASLSGYSQLASVSKASPSDVSAFKLTWERIEKDLGKIEVGIPISTEFVFTNHGKEALIITDVKAQCGCTVSSYTKKAVLPGESGTIKATFNAAKAGAFRKGLTVYTNTDLEPFQLYFKGEVVSATSSLK